jgi:predicted RNase H-like HicB family nuclease
VNQVRYFPAVIEKSSDGYGVFFPDLPGCTSAGATVQEAALNAEEALQAHIELSLEHGDTIPAPSTLDEIVVDADVTEAARILVRVDPPGRTVRVNITMPEDLLAAVDRYAIKTGYSRSGLLAQAVRERLRRDQTAA